MSSAYTQNKYLTVLGIFIVSLLISYFHGWGYINIYYCSYLKLFDPSLTMLNINFIFTMLYLSEMCFWPLADYIKTKQNYSGAQCLAVFLMSSKFLVMIWVPNYHVWMCTNILAGLAGCQYDINSTRLLLEWFPGQIGIAGGLNSAGFSFGSFWSFLAYQSINPNNEPATIEEREGYRVTRLFDSHIALNVPSFLHVCLAINLVYAFICPFIISNDPSKFCKDPMRKPSEDNSIDLGLVHEFDTVSIPSIRKESIQELSMETLNMSLLNELESIDDNVGHIGNSVKFFTYIIIMSYMLGLPLFFNISKKSVGINALDDLSVTFLSLPTTFLILFGRQFGAVIMENVGMNRFIVFWLSVSSFAIVLYYFYASNKFVFFLVNSLLMMHQGMSYSCKMVYLITLYGETYGKKLIVRAMTIMSIFRAFWPIFFDYCMTAVGMETLYCSMIVTNVFIIYLVQKVL